MTLGIWYEALMRWIGPAETVVAMGGRVIGSRTDPETGRPRFPSIPDHLEVLARMRCGAQARFHFSTVFGLLPEKSITLFGTEGTLRFSDGRLTGGRRGDDELKSVPVRPEEADEWRVEADFISAVRGEAPVRLTTFDDGVRYMAFTEAVHQSLSRGGSVPVETVGSPGSGERMRS
jgi:predicted dehydrogenase